MRELTALGATFWGVALRWFGKVNALLIEEPLAISGGGRKDRMVAITSELMSNIVTSLVLAPLSMVIVLKEVDACVKSQMTNNLANGRTS